jgi:endonuclease/exonuclease/phosphatase family metal-dependent hydrolase
LRLASFNVESLFERPVAMAPRTKAKGNGTGVAAVWAPAADILGAYARLNTILAQNAYSDPDKGEIVQLLKDLGLGRADDSKWAVLRQNRGRLLRRPLKKDPIVIANGRADWLGWVELKKEPLSEVSIQNTGRAIKEVGADVQAVVEAESRIALLGISGTVLPNIGGTPFEHVMLIDGNDERGIDVGLMTRNGWQITGIRSHVDDADETGHLIFSRDCAQYTVENGVSKLILLVNHFKSKGYGDPRANNAKRHLQATRVAAIYASLIADGEDHVAILGDFNDYQDSAPLQPLLGGTDLRDVGTHPNFDSDPRRPGTFGNCTAREKFDYILLSPALYAKVTGGAVMKKGSWGGSKGTLWPHFPEIKRQVDQASDHAAIYADLDL